MCVQKWDRTCDVHYIFVNSYIEPRKNSQRSWNIYRENSKMSLWTSYLSKNHEKSTSYENLDRIYSDLGLNVNLMRIELDDYPQNRDWMWINSIRKLRMESYSSRKGMIQAKRSQEFIISCFKILDVNKKIGIYPCKSIGCDWQMEMLQKNCEELT